MNAQHRVRRLRWQARTGDAAQAFALRTLLRERRGEWQAALARALDEFGAGDEVWRLPRLALTVRVPSLDALAAQGPQQLAEGLAAALRELRADAPTHEAAATERAPSLQRLEAPARERALLRTYLDTGLLDWTLAGLPMEAARARLRTAAQSLAQADVGEALALWPREREARERWLLRWFALLPPEAWRTLALRLWRAEVVGPESDAPHEAASPGAAARRLAQAVPFPPVTAALPTVLPRESTTPREAERAEASLLVPDAGLVLLHPFLPQLFAACGLWSESTPRGVGFGKLAPRAAALLHWLAHGGDESAQEFELALVKLLLGLSPDEALAPQPLRDDDRAHGAALLRDAIAHWRALGASGLDALRTTFLQRRGLLEARGDTWHLRIESAPFDVLLARLPWSLAWVKLPWMTRSLSIDWPAP